MSGLNREQQKAERAYINLTQSYITFFVELIRIFNISSVM